MNNNSPAQLMTKLGIRQDPAEILSQKTTPVIFPHQTDLAVGILKRLRQTISQAKSIHNFAKGLGVAAPQIGIDKSVAMVETAQGEVFELVNPQVIYESSETDKQYEGCWSFFDWRGLVPRPLTIRVQYQTVSGKQLLENFNKATARLMMHEIDHLNGVLYKERMLASDSLITLDQYHSIDKGWSYES